MRWIALLILIIVLIVWWLNRDRAAPEGTRSETPAGAVAPVAARAATGGASPAAAPTPDPLQQHWPQLQLSAQRIGISIAHAEPTPGGAILRVQWMGDVASLGGDFLAQAMADGAIRDFDVKALEIGKGQDPSGRQLWSAAYRVRF